MCTRRISWG